MSTLHRRHRRALLAVVPLLTLVLTGCSGSAASLAPEATASPAPPASAAAIATMAPTPTARTTTPSPGPAASPWPSVPDAQLPDDVSARLDRALAQGMSTSAAPGAAAAIITPDGTWVGVTGKDGAGEPLGPTFAFGIGSTSKTVTAAELLFLAEQGRLDLDTPVDQLIDLPFETNGATVRQLATMQSGFPTGSDTDLEVEVAKDLDRTWTVDDMLKEYAVHSRAGTVGGPGHYNGVNYQALTAVIEKVTGESFATAVRRDLLDPAGLDRMWVQAQEKPEAPLAIAQDLGTGIIDRESGYLPSLAAASTGNGAAALAADAPTLARWGYLLYGGHVISPASVAVMTKPNWASELGYGFGAMIDNSSGTNVVGHAGDYMGYSSMLMAWPEEHVAIAMLAPRQGIAVNMELPMLGYALHTALVAP